MKIELEQENMPDELYNQLLKNFVQRAVKQGLTINKNSQFNNWTISCEVLVTPH